MFRKRGAEINVNNNNLLSNYNIDKSDAVQCCINHVDCDGTSQKVMELLHDSAISANFSIIIRMC